MASKWKRSSETLVNAFYACMEEFSSNVEMRKMFGYPCSFKNGNMFTGLHEENWIVRLPEEERQELIDSHGATTFEPMKGRPMREYVTLPKTIRSNTSLLKKWISKSLAFTSAMPPKVPKKRKNRNK